MYINPRNLATIGVISKSSDKLTATTHTIQSTRGQEEGAFGRTASPFRDAWQGNTLYVKMTMEQIVKNREG